EPFVTLERVSADQRTRLDVFPDFGLDRFLLRVRDDFGADFLAALQNPDDDRLPARAPAVNLLGPLVGVHVPGLAANKRFIDLDFAAQLVKGPGLHCQPDTM